MEPVKIIVERHKCTKPLIHQGFLLCLTHYGPKGIRTYPELFTRDGGQIAVEFPDLPGCVTCSDTEDLTMGRVKEALEGFLYYMEQDNRQIGRAHV